MFDVLVYVYEHYWRGDVCPELPLLGRKLSAAGFEPDEIEQALNVDHDEWAAELPLIEEWFNKVGDKMPTVLWTELDGLKSRLGA